MCSRATSNNELYGLFVCYLGRTVDNRRKTCEYSTLVSLRSSLADRRELQSHNFFKNILQPTLCLHYLVPPPRDAQLLSRLGAPSKFPRILNRIKKYHSFMSYALSHYHYQQFYSDVLRNIRVNLSVFILLIHCHCCCACAYCAVALFSRFGYKFNKQSLFMWYLIFLYQ